MSKKISLYTLGMFALGILSGLLIPQLSPHIAFIGDLYINLLKMLIIPTLFFRIATATSKDNIGKIAIKTMCIFVVMFIASFAITAVVVSIIQPGANAQFINVEWGKEPATISLSSFIAGLAPPNILAAAADNQMLPVILFAFAMGIAINQLELSAVEKIFSDCSKIFTKMLEWVMYLTPFGVFSLMANTITNYGISVLKSALVYILTAWSCCLIALLLIMILPAWIIGKVNPITYVKNVYELWLITSSTCSSPACLPVTIRICNEKFNIPKNITDIVASIGCTFHKCGGAIGFALLALFNMQMYGMEITLSSIITIFFAALVINMGGPGVPGGGVITGATFLTVLGLPLDFIGFYAGIYRLLDMVYTTMNTTDDITASILINAWDKK